MTAMMLMRLHAGFFPLVSTSAARTTSSVLMMSLSHPGAFLHLVLLEVKRGREPPSLGAVETKPCGCSCLLPGQAPETSGVPSLCCQLARRGHPSIHLGSQARVETPLNLLAALVPSWPRKATESMEFITGWWAPTRERRRGRPVSRRNGISVGMNHRAVQQEWGRMDGVVPASSPRENQEEGVCFCAHRQERKKGIAARSEERQEWDKCD